MGLFDSVIGAAADALQGGTPPHPTTGDAPGASGVMAAQLSESVSQLLPRLINQLTPQGRIPEEGLGNAGALLGQLGGLFGQRGGAGAA